MSSTGGRHERYLSVVIPTYRDASCLRHVLRSLGRQTLPRDRFEVVAVHDGPPGAEYEELAGTASELIFRFECLDEHRGRAAARNQGLRVARGDVVLFLDSDSYTAPDLLERHHRFHAGHESPMVLLGQRHDVEWPVARRLMDGGEADPAELAETSAPWFPASYGEDRVRQCLETPWLFAPTHNASLPTRLAFSAGLFDEGFGRRWGFEDVEFFYRVYGQLGRRGDAFRHDARAVCYHLPRYRSSRAWQIDYLINELVARRRHPNFEWELGWYPPLRVAEKLRHYRRVLTACRRTGLGRLPTVWPHVAELLGTSSRIAGVCAAFGTEGLPLADGVVTYDHGRPASERNRHLLGVNTLAQDGAYDVLVNVDLWRFLLWEDLCDLVAEATRVAARVVLVYSRNLDEAAGVAPFDDVDYLTDVLRPHVRVGTEARDDVVLLRLESAGPIGATAPWGGGNGTGSTDTLLPS